MKKKKQLHPFFSFKKIQQYFLSLIFTALVGSLFVSYSQVNNARAPQEGHVAEFYANQSGDDLTYTFTSAINSAEKSVLLMIYSLTDKKIIDSLKNKRQSGVDVKVICDAKAAPYIDVKLGSKIAPIRRFGPGLMHQKILVIDNKKIWIGSANMTSDSLCLHGNLVTAMESTELAEIITSKADTLKVEGKGPSFPHQLFSIGGQKVEMWFLPDNKDGVGRIKSIIQSAQKTIRVAMFTWTRQDLAQAIIRATKRGVRTEVVLDHLSAKGASAKIAKLLKENGVKISVNRGEELLHHKFLYVDGTILVHGSANWTKAAFTQNDDCFIIMHDLTKTQSDRMDSLWGSIVADSITYQ